ncbi:MAG: type II toxin-antitoxin system VapC family toxin [Candidatus Acidiferrales bacterium]
MLYFDASALVKRYLRESGSDEVDNLFKRDEQLFTSVLSFAEVHAAFGRKLHNREINRAVFERARSGFLDDYMFALYSLNLDVGTMAAVPSLTERHPIRGADAVQLSSALWLRDMTWLSPEFAAGDRTVKFVTADERLAEFAVQSELSVLIPR